MAETAKQLHSPELTVVVATYNGATGLQHLLESLAHQDLQFSRFEVIVTVDGSTDGTWEYLQAADMPYRLRSIWQRNQGPAAARDAAILLARGDIILTLDDDVEPVPSLLRRHLAAHDDGKINAVIGPMIFPDTEPLTGWVRWEYEGLLRQYTAMEDGQWSATPRQFYTANASLPRKAYIEAGLFDPLFRRAEDIDLAFHLANQGVDFQFLPDVPVFHRPRRGFDSWQRMAWLYGFYDIVMTSKKGRDYILVTMSREHQYERSPLLRAAARLLLKRRMLLHAFLCSSGILGRAASRLGRRRLANMCYSAVFGLRYLEGAAAAFGDPRDFLRTLNTTGIRVTAGNLNAT